MTSRAFTLALLAGPVGDAYRDDAALDELGARFAAEGYVKLPALLTCEAIELLRGEIAALEPVARARDFVMPGPATPRVMSVLGAQQLLAGSTALAMLYTHFELVRVISQLAGARVHGCRHPDELMVCNFLLKDGSTHGWHLDDPAYALVIVLEAPAAGRGRELEYVSDWDDVCDGLGSDPRAEVDVAVARARSAGLIRTVHHQPGDAYLLRADRCLHRVVALRDARGRRVALNFAYERTATAVHGESATMLYGSDAPTSA
ncbi:MAG TPA: hypothetical protein VGO80_13490 [Solirubrobacteraceae bacterium]|jgi:hypothetical protein|nr:hypothetical protein [Solirubrobacteraceae bacterium]